MSTATSESDVAIIGAGPCGLFGGYYAGFRGLKCAFFDSLPELGGQISAMYPEKFIFDTPGFPKVLGRDLVAKLVEQASQFQPQIYLDDAVQSLTKEGERSFVVGTAKGRIHRAKAVLISAGVGMFTPRKLGVTEVDSFEGKGLVYSVKAIKDFEGKNVLILGGGDSAVDWVLNLFPVAKHITIVHRRDEFRAHEESVRQMKELPKEKVSIRVFSELRQLSGNGWVKEAKIEDTKTKQLASEPVDSVVSCLGFISNLGPMKNWGLEFEGGQLKVTSRMETNIPGVYGAGDLVAYPGKVRLIALGYGEAAIAANHIAAYINPKAQVFPGHSSNIGEKKEEKATAK